LFNHAAVVCLKDAHNFKLMLNPIGLMLLDFRKQSACILTMSKSYRQWH